jgi:hypothetical protein
MGTWGINPFENDDAMDWLGELQEKGDLAFLAASLSPEEIEGYLEAPDGVCILCASEIIAAAVTGESENLPAEALSWLQEHDLDLLSLVPLARTKVARVLADRSEISELWEENPEDFPAWRDSVVRLQARLVK